jgi:hypothetical protein
LEHYLELAIAHKTLQQPAPRELVAKVIRTADRWRTLDDNITPACRMAARVLDLLGETDLAWDYLTTPLQTWTPERADTLELARHLAGENDRLKADRAYRLAVEAEPENFTVFWERIDNLRQMGERTVVRKLLQDLAESQAPLEQRERARRESQAEPPRIPQ